MSISSVTSKVVYVGTGSTAAAARVFAYPFKILAATDLTVSEYNNSTSAATAKTLSTHYDVSGVGSSGGGNVTITGSYTNLPTGCQLVIQRVMDLTQETDYVENDAFSAETHETALDKLTMISQQLQEQLDRAVLADVTQTSPDLDVIASVTAAKSSATVAMQQAVLSSAYAGATTTANPTFTGVATMATANITDLILGSEGVWAATFSSGSGTVAIDTNYSSGSYVRVGKKITVTGNLVTGSVSSNTGSFMIVGLPFPCGNANRYTTSISIYADGLLSGGATAIMGYISKSTNYIVLTDYATGATRELSADVQAGTSFIINATYFTD